MAKAQKVSFLIHTWAKQQPEPRSSPPKRGIARVHTPRFTFSSISELGNVARVLAFWLVVMAALVALDVWLWMPHAVR
jgi:hypothetical protein